MTSSMRTPEHMIRTSQIIALGMIGGVLGFCVVAVFIVGGFPAEGEGKLVSVVMAGLTLPQLALYFFVSTFIPERIVQQGNLNTNLPPELKPYQVMQLRTIIGFAFLEGGCFMNIIAFIIEKNWWSLALVCVFVLFMLSNFPTATRFHYYAESEQNFT